MSLLRIRNPKSELHLVPMYSYQKLEVVISSEAAPDFSTVGVEIRSEWLELQSTTCTVTEKTFLFSMTKDMGSWTPISTHALGSLHFNSAYYNSRLCVNLETVNRVKRDIVTVINPNHNVIKIYPHQIIEVVCSNPVWGTEMTWGRIEIDERMELLATSCITPSDFEPKQSIRSINDAFYVYPRTFGWKTTPVHHEYHFWYRLKPAVAKLLSGIPGGISAVSMKFSGLVDHKIKSEHQLEIQFNRRSKTPGTHRSEEVTFNDSRMDKNDREQNYKKTMRDIFINDDDDEYQGALPPGHYSRQERKLERQRQKSLDRERESNRVYNEPIELKPGEYVVTSTTYGTQYQNQKQKVTRLVNQRTTSLEIKESLSLEDGCRTLHLADEEVLDPGGFIDDADLLDCCDCNDDDDRLIELEMLRLDDDHCGYFSRS